MEEPKQPNPYIRYSNLALQMASIIGLTSWGGYKLDEYFKNTNSVFTITLSLLGIFTALFVVLKDLIKIKD